MTQYTTRVHQRIVRYIIREAPRVDTAVLARLRARPVAGNKSLPTRSLRATARDTRITRCRRPSVVNSTVGR